MEPMLPSPLKMTVLIVNIYIIKEGFASSLNHERNDREVFLILAHSSIVNLLPFNSQNILRELLIQETFV